MAQRPLWWLTVLDKVAVEPSLFRIRLGGNSLKNFPQGREGDYIKLLLPKEAGYDIHAVDPQDPDLSPFHKRSYTVCEFDGSALSLYVTRHSSQFGPAADWAATAAPGDEVLITGPGPVDQLDVTAPAFLVVGDLPSLGAILANLRRLPASAQGHLIFEAPCAIPLVEQACPPGICIHWVGESTSGFASELFAAVKRVGRPVAGTDIWAVCEYSNMKLLRDYFVAELGLAKTDFYLSSYFKRGATDEQHKQTRREEGYKD